MGVVAGDGHKTIICYIIERVVMSNMGPKQLDRSAASAKRNDAIAVVTINPEMCWEYPKSKRAGHIKEYSLRQGYNTKCEEM
jgi:hypothetical protein